MGASSLTWYQDNVDSVTRAQPLLAAYPEEIRRNRDFLVNAEAALAEDLESLAKVQSGQADIDAERGSFEGFMAACRRAADGTEVTATCVEMYREANGTAARSVPLILSETVPQGILLLFLLATLSGLYRYNTRMAGFHHARADVLELMSERGLQMDRLPVLTQILAADGVDFRNVNTPTDQAVEIVHAALARGK
ncbi:hypothetical protein [Amaricoccus tamworthensis]|uniref:hypothetical protein n=1 Tax=Amaricoccus tamworthensis TaxID=57002 RepID=UPI003C7AEFEB